MKPQCIYCGKPVLVSKKTSSEGNINPVTGEIGVWLAHNTCMDEARETKAMLRLTEACDGDATVAGRVRAALMNAPGSLTLWRRR